MKRFFLAVGFLALTGCDAPEYGTSYELRDGTVIHCQSIMSNECGMNFSRCADGFEYFCQQDVRAIRE